MSRLIDRAVAAAGLEGWLARRLRGESTNEDRARLPAMCAELDLLLLGAIADRVRASELGPLVRLHLDRPADTEQTLALDREEMGHALMRRVAAARLEGPPGRTVRVDVESVGLPVAQVALAFGANELVAPLRGLSLHVYGEDEANAREQAVLRERELAALVRSAQREPVIVRWKDDVSLERSVDEASTARRKFRAPGREGNFREEGEI